MCTRSCPLRLIGVSVVQSIASAVLAPSLRHVADMLALNWRARVTRSAFIKYLAGRCLGAGPPKATSGSLLPRPPRSRARQHVLHGFAAGWHDGHRSAAHTRYRCVAAFFRFAVWRCVAGLAETLCHCTSARAERLCDDLAALIPTLVKPVVDITWFSWQLWRLTGRRGMIILYLYTMLGWGSLRCAEQYCISTQACAHVVRFSAAQRGHARLWRLAEAGAVPRGRVPQRTCAPAHTRRVGCAAETPELEWQPSAIC